MENWIEWRVIPPVWWWDSLLEDEGPPSLIDVLYVFVLLLSTIAANETLIFLGKKKEKEMK